MKTILSKTIGIIRQRPKSWLRASFASTSTSTTTTSSNDILQETTVPVRVPNRVGRDVRRDWKIDLSSDLVGAGAFAEVRNCKATDSNTKHPTVERAVIKSFHHDTDVYFDSLNRELAALDDLQNVKEIHNYLTAYGETFFNEDDNNENDNNNNEDDTDNNDVDLLGREGELHIVSEYIPHGDLFDYITSCPNGQVNIKNIISIGHQMALALNGSHRHGWIHLDVKPENVCLMELGNHEEEDDGLTPVIKLIDFGHARPYPIDSTLIEGEAGSDSYAAPEVLRLQQFSPTSDTWSYGILMYAMLCGNLPWPEGGQSEFLFDQKRINSTLNQVETRFDTRVVDLLRLCLVIDVKTRASMSTLLENNLFKNTISDQAPASRTEYDLHSERILTVNEDEDMMNVFDIIAIGSKLPDFKRKFILKKKEIKEVRRKFTMGKLRRMASRTDFLE